MVSTSPPPAPPSALLRMEFHSANDPPQIIETTLAELKAHQHRSTLGGTEGLGSGNSLLVHRALDDSLRLKVESDNLIFSSGETLRLTVTPAIASLAAGASLDLSAELVEGRNGTVVWSNTDRVSLSPAGTAVLPIEIPLPEQAGVYTVRLTAKNPPGNRVRFWGEKEIAPLAQRSFQAVVLSDQPARNYSGSPTGPRWKTLLEIDPTNPHWWSRLPDWTRLSRWSGSHTGPMGSAPFRTTEWHGKTLAEIVAGQNGASSWQAYPLQGARPGQPHVVEIDLPANTPQQLALRIFEPNAAGKLTAVGPGSIAAVQPWDASTNNKPSTVTYRYLFWPRTNEPVLVVQNADPSTSARYGTVRLKIAESSAPSKRTDSPATNAQKPASSAQKPATNAQEIDAYFSWAGLIARTGATRVAPTGRAATDDWLTFYETAERLADYLELAGYSGAVVNVFADGGAACNCGDYPLTPWMNSSRIGSGMDDLPKADPLELLLRVFERRGLRLTPTFRFTSSLPGVEQSLRQKEQLLRQHDRNSMPVWTDPSGRPRWAVSLQHPASPPYYNLSHPAVQDEVQRLLTSILDRYSNSPAFDRLGIELSADSYLPLPPVSYGITRASLTQLAATTNTPAKELTAWLQDPRLPLANPAVRHAWNQQRTAPMTHFYRSIAQTVRQHRPDASLLLLTDNLLASREYNTMVRPRLASRGNLKAIYLERGVDLEALRQTVGIELPLVHRTMVASQLNDAAMAMGLNQLASSYRSTKQELQQPTRTVRQPRWLPTPNLGGTSPLLSAAWSRMVVDRVDNARNESLLKAFLRNRRGSLIVGGPLGPNLGSESDTQLLRLVCQLPTPSTAKAIDQIEQQPIAARAIRSAGKTTYVVMNPSPWPVEAIVTLKVESHAEGRLLSGSLPADEAVATSYAPGLHAWNITLAPYSLQAMELSTAQAKLAGLRMQLPATVQTELAARCKALEQRDLKPNKLPTYNALTNPSFEQAGDNRLPVGWISLAGQSDTTTPGLAGEHALRLIATGDSTSIASQPFAVPPTGQIALTAYVKAVNVDKDSELRLVIEEVGASNAPRFVALSAARLLQDHKQRDWNGYQFGVEDLPLDSTAKMRIRFELVGKGEIWIDNIELYDLVYPLDLYETESQQQVLALVQHLQQTRTALNEQRYSDCLDQLDSYRSQFLLTYLPVMQEEPKPSQVAKPAKTDESTEPRLSDRFRNMFRF